MTKEMGFLSPIDGDMLNERDGWPADGGLVFRVVVSADPGHPITVNGNPALYRDGAYTSLIRLEQYANVIEVADPATGERKIITVYRLRNFTGHYRLSLDDNIWFLQDIARQVRSYRSLFDNPYLGFYRQVHQEFGTKVHMNIYYRTDEFDLTQMPDKFKSEWRDSADWLRLSFHARQDTPDMPYLHAGYEEMKRDCGLVREQILRFAGEEVLGPVTTLHWGAATVEGCRALRDLGYRCQVGDFNVDNDLPAVSYYLDVEQRRHINQRFLWKDNREDIVFFRSAIIMDCHKLEDIPRFLDDIYADPCKSGYMDLLIHEQYFYPHYGNYQQDYRDKVLAGVRWAAEKGYRPEFLERCVLE